MGASRALSEVTVDSDATLNSKPRVTSFAESYRQTSRLRIPQIDTPGIKANYVDHLSRTASTRGGVTSMRSWKRTRAAIAAHGAPYSTREEKRKSRNQREG
ncbi:hypothetical protein AVEN_267681-1 [Araneus ventricosus]|uniref:Uncharacterized protein n=1 Tax=Araneus ventricosus TaxID=182803 RepID=A0A4Y2N1L6_ARAVE|nr:hypothetical protein AVEN_267681-1 [Araneus ventricosus]